MYLFLPHEHPPVSGLMAVVMYSNSIAICLNLVSCWWEVLEIIFASRISGSYGLHSFDVVCLFLFVLSSSCRETSKNEIPTPLRAMKSEKNKHQTGAKTCHLLQTKQHHEIEAIPITCSSSLTFLLSSVQFLKSGWYVNVYQVLSLDMKESLNLF